jgi:cytoplasmic FMR1 interacting protein
LGRSINLAGLIRQRMNKMFRENLDFLLERFESQDLCAIVELQRLVEILELTHELLSEHVKMDPFNLMMSEMTETISLVSFSGRVATQVRIQKKRQMFQLQQIWQTAQSLELDLKTLKPNNQPQ